MDFEVFKDGWDSSKETACGYGSEKRNTRIIREVLPHIVRGFAIHSILDAGCGDINWFPLDEFPHYVRYVGVDLFPRQPGIIHADITTSNLPPVDLIVCRDVMIHFDNDTVLQTLHNFRRSCAEYLLATTFRCVYNSWRGSGGLQHYPLDLAAPPFNLGEPLLLIPENYPNKFCGLWSLQCD
jgi:hypothetical protein